LQSA